MKPRSRAGDKPVKTRRRKAATPKLGKAAKAVRRRSSSAASLRKKVALLTRERDEALEQADRDLRGTAGHQQFGAGLADSVQYSAQDEDALDLARKLN